MRRAGMALTIVAALAVSAAGVALAEEVVHLSNGTFLTIRSHSVENGMVRVVLGTDAEMAFPLDMVERIERGGVDVLGGSAGPRAAANQAVEGEANGAMAAPTNQRDYPVTGASSAGRSVVVTPRGTIRDREPLALVTGGPAPADEPEDPVIKRPFENHPNPNLRRISSVRVDHAPQESGKNRELSDGRGPRRKFPTASVVGRSGGSDDKSEN